MKDEKLMDRAMELAANSKPKIDSIPKVGCVIAIKGKIIAEAKRGEEDHAEKIAILDALKTEHDLSKATVYTTLEPCTHHSRRDPGESCTERLIAMRVRKVWVGALDPNQDICGRGILALQRNGIEVALFPHDQVIAIQRENAEFVRMQQTIGMTVTDPINAANRLPAGNRHTIAGRYLNKPQPGECQILVGNKTGIWWPQPFEIEFRDDKTWRATIDLTQPGEYVVTVVRANALGQALIVYFEKVKEIRAKRRNDLATRLRNDSPESFGRLADADLTKALGTDWTGISLSLQLPKGLDPQVWLTYVVEKPIA